MRTTWRTSSYSDKANCLDVGWRTSSYSQGSASCVEVGATPDAVCVRDTKNRAGGNLDLTKNQWGVFLGAVKRGFHA